MAAGETRISERIEQSRVGRGLITVGIVAVLLLEVGIHLPDGSALHQAVNAPANEYIRIVGSEQAWNVFAPDPRSTSIQLEARVTFADGSTAIWHLPEGPVLGANLRFYRWRKWLERVRSDDYKSLWHPTAEWIASLYDDAASPVSRVELVRRVHRNSLLGPPPPYEETIYFTYVPPPEHGS